MEMNKFDTYPDLWSSFFETQTAVNVSSKRQSSFFLQFSGRQSSPETAKIDIMNNFVLYLLFIIL